MAQRSAPERGVLGDLRRMAPELPTSVRSIAEQLLADPVAGVSGTIHDLAAASGSSPSAVSRLCRRLGVDGYPGLRIAVLADAPRSGASAWELDVSRTISPEDSLEDVARVLGAAQARAVQDTLAGLDLAAVRAAADRIVAARRVHVFGVSGSSVMGTELQIRLHRIGIPVWSHADVHEGLTAAALLGPGDVALAISATGTTVETLEVVRCAAAHGATTVAVTGVRTSPLADLADHVLLTVTEETTFRAGPLAARFSELTVIELVYLAVAQQTAERTTELLEATAEAVHGHTGRTSPRTTRPRTTPTP
ncbi:MurR/RpiR family transcriptional regulator [Auraticoccus monumenti]|uniref:DNA-binding transcriptional regulator, MurR/RpiR family, contains HTH and SIS domains n=1 Tax=Auraticoccus monumenti TaxID=675864 RepID=A0A1G6TU73_9ACTN|nr:MurR/RpiR family transcriptional regulator [Auraticoccus monumenti]SDD32643.1 DNA-binding transcriptional regulator, MurR/RpiR family, contains HTH and SIS domains [Auraticoccus monumenti]